MDSIDHWKTKAESLVRTRECVYQRNQEITANYARVYLKHPELYKWAGMAAFASFHIRLVLKPFALSGQDRCSLPTTESGKIVKEVNDAIFDDIFWAHLLYDGSEAGFVKLKELLSPYPDKRPLLDAFSKLEEGRKMLEAGDEEATNTIWKANRDLLEHEQRAMVQPRFSRLQPGISKLISLFSTMHYQAGGRCKQMFLPGSFLYFMAVRRGIPRARIPSLAEFDQRWQWIEEGILPGFRCYEIDRKRICSDLRKLVDLVENENNSSFGSGS